MQIAGKISIGFIVSLIGGILIFVSSARPFGLLLALRLLVTVISGI